MKRDALERSSAGPEKVKAWVPALIVVAGLAAYCGSLSGPFIFDDIGSILQNPSIHRLWGALHTPFGDGRTVEGRPILNLSLAIDYAISETDVWSYHATNVLIHVLGGLALFGIVRRTLAVIQPSATGMLSRKLRECGPLLPALSVALIWTVHPVQTEAVTYVIQRAESLMGLFYLVTIYCFVRFAENGAAAWSWASVACCLLAMGTKEVAVTLPVMVLMFDRTFFAGSFPGAWRRRSGYYLALAATWIFLGFMVAAGGGTRSGSSGVANGHAWLEYYLTQFVALGRYLRLSLWPHPLVFDYGYFHVGLAEALPYALVVGLLGIATLWALVRSPALGFLGFWFFGILAVTSLMPGAKDMIVERRVYLPVAAVISLVVLGLYAVYGKRAFGLVLVVAVGLASLTWVRNLDYKSNYSIWKSSLQYYPDNPRAYRSLGFLLGSQGKLTEARAAYEEAVRLRPDSSEAQNDLGTAYFQLGELDESIVHYREALRLDPTNSGAHFNLGNSLLGLGQITEAIAQFEEAVRIDPANLGARSNLGTALMQSGRLDEAKEQFNAVLNAEPTSAVAHFNVANILASQGLLEEAIGHYRQALAARPNFPKAHYNLGTALVRVGRIQEAVTEYREAIRENPGFTQARADLARLEAYLSSRP